MKLYETDGNCSEFSAKVVSCTKNSVGNYEVILSQTAFFPEGGGQSSDEGTINGFPVLSLRSENNETVVVHTIAAELEVGSVVVGKVDMSVRFPRMQNHTAEHICSGIIHSLFGYENIGFHMSADEITMDFNGVLTPEDLSKVEILANRAVYANLPISVKFYEPGTAADVAYRSKKEIKTTLRLVEIEGVDICACCAPHVSRTGEIGIIKILGAQKYKGGMRVSLLAGEMAFNELTKHYNNVKSISNSLSSHPDDICKRFELLQSDLYNTKAERTAVKQQYYTLLASGYDNCEHDNILFFEKNSSADDMRFFVNLLKQKTDKFCAVFSGEEGNYNFIAASDHVDMTVIAKYLRENLKASCGGKAQMIQGSLKANESDIRLAIDKISCVSFSIDFNKRIGKIKPMHCVGNAPIMGDNNMLFHYLGEAGIPYSRLHDTGGAYGGGCFVDIANIFRNFDADAKDPASYDFAFTDWLISELDKQGVKTFYRLGSSIECEHRINAYNIFPPKDYQKWAEICAGIIRHYNEGWANGFHYNIEFWEIWNEPDNEPVIDDNPLWKGTKEDYFRLYEITSNYLKKEFPSIKVGGYASCGFYGISESAFSANANSSHRVEYFLEFFHDFLKYISSSEHKSPLDFFSWHSYLTIDKNREYAAYAREQLDLYGFKDTLNILNEWNMGPDIRGTVKDASYISGMICAMQNTSLDMLMYYDAQVHASYGGIFDPVHKTVFKSYYAFKAFNELYVLGNQIDCTAPNDKDIITLAAASDDAKKGAVLLTNMSSEPKCISFNMPCDVKGIVCIGVDKDLNYTPVENYHIYANDITIKMTPNSFYLFNFEL